MNMATRGYLDGIAGRDCVEFMDVDYFMNWKMGFAEFMGEIA